MFWRLLVKVEKGEKLSNLRITNILIEVTLFATGLINNIEITLLTNNDYEDFLNNIYYLETYPIKMIINLTLAKKSLRILKIIAIYINEIY